MNHQEEIKALQILAEEQRFAVNSKILELEMAKNQHNATIFQLNKLQQVTLESQMEEVMNEVQKEVQSELQKELPVQTVYVTGPEPKLSILKRNQKATQKKNKTQVQKQSKPVKGRKTDFTILHLCINNKMCKRDRMDWIDIAEKIEDETGACTLSKDSFGIKPSGELLGWVRVKYDTPDLAEEAMHHFIDIEKDNLDKKSKFYMQVDYLKI